ncbi:MAG: homoserine kinase [Deferrisomatales bacterium]
MAVYTPVEWQEAERFLQGYGVGPLEGLEPIAQGIENTNFKVRAGGRAYVLTVFEREPAASVEQTLRLTLELARRGVPCPRPLTASGGIAVGAVRGKPAALVEFVEGEVVWAPGEDHLEALGRALARLHLAGEDLAFARTGPHLASVLVPLARRLAGCLGGEQAPVADLLREEAAYQEAVPDRGLPGGVVHGDLFLDNVLFAPGRPRVRALLDFYLAGSGPWLYDLAVVLLDAGWGGRAVVGDRARALLRGYRALRPVTGEEYAWLPAYLRRAALRFLCLRVERAYVAPDPMAAGRPKDPAEYADKLRALRTGFGGEGR